MYEVYYSYYTLNIWGCQATKYLGEKTQYFADRKGTWGIAPNIKSKLLGGLYCPFYQCSQAYIIRAIKLKLWQNENTPQASQLNNWLKRKGNGNVGGGCKMGDCLGM